jgi:hypothetical protein
VFCRFFFAVSNTRAGQSYRFNLVNLLKDDSLYNHGMLPLVHSERRLAEEVRAARRRSSSLERGLPLRACL